jgi:hypothetical protein
MLNKVLEWASVSIGVALFLGPFEIKKYINRDVKMLCQRAFLSIGALLGKLEVDSLARTF